MKNNKCFRHGEIAFIEIESLPIGVEESKTNVFAKGNTGNSHTFRGGSIYPKVDGQFIIGYFKSENTKLFHDEHSPKGVSLPDGFYEIRKASEWVNGELKVVID